MARERNGAAIKGLNAAPVKEILADSGLDGKGALTQQVYRLLRGLIVNLVLLPNQFLSEKDVAGSLRLSKTPIREAFIRLAEDGIVKIVPKSGTYVAPVDIDSAREGHFVRNALEASCAARAAELCTLGDVRRLREQLGFQKALVECSDFAGFSAANARFHHLIFEIADIPDAGAMIDAARFETDRIWRMQERYSREEAEKAVAEHSDIVNAIALHDSDSAREGMERHLVKVLEAVDSLAKDRDMRGLLDFLNRKRPGTRRSRAGKNGECG